MNTIKKTNDEYKNVMAIITNITYEKSTGNYYFSLLEKTENLEKPLKVLSKHVNDIFNNKGPKTELKIKIKKHMMKFSNYIDFSKDVCKILNKYIYDENTYYAFLIQPLMTIKSL
jgi:hypothetical protein